MIIIITEINRYALANVGDDWMNALLCTFAKNQWLSITHINVGNGVEQL